MTRPLPRLLMALGLVLCVPPLVSTGGRLRSFGKATLVDEQMIFLQRLAPVKAMLAGTARVGFLTDHPPETPPLYGFPHPHHQEHEALVRFQLLPTIVVCGADESMAVGLFADMPAGLAKAARLGLRPLRTFDGGFVVLLREGR